MSDKDTKESGFLGIFEKHRQNLEASDAEGNFLSCPPSRFFRYSKKQTLIALDQEDQVGRIGGPCRVPILREVYLLAAERLTQSAIDHSELDELAIPILYCLRHTLELALKDLILLTFEVRDLAEEIPDTEISCPTYKEINKLNEHSLETLANILEAQLQIIWSDDARLPQDFRDVALRIHKIENEGTIGESFRYTYKDTYPNQKDITYRPGRDVRLSLPERNHHFRRSTPIPIGKLTQDVRNVIHSHFFDRSDKNETYPWRSPEQKGLEAELTLQLEAYSNEYNNRVLLPEIYDSDDRQQRLKKFQEFIGKFKSIDQDQIITPEDAETIAGFLEVISSMLIDD